MAQTAGEYLCARAGQRHQRLRAGNYETFVVVVRHHAPELGYLCGRVRDSSAGAATSAKFLANLGRVCDGRAGQLYKTFVRSWAMGSGISSPKNLGKQLAVVGVLNCVDARSCRPRRARDGEWNGMSAILRSYKGRGRDGRLLARTGA